MAHATSPKRQQREERMKMKILIGIIKISVRHGKSNLDFFDRRKREQITASRNQDNRRPRRNIGMVTDEQTDH